MASDHMWPVLLGEGFAPSLYSIPAAVPPHRRLLSRVWWRRWVFKKEELALGRWRCGGHLAARNGALDHVLGYEGASDSSCVGGLLSKGVGGRGMHTDDPEGEW